MRAGLALAALLLLACADGAWTRGTSARVTGSVRGAGPLALPDGAVVRVTLSKVVPADARTVLIDEQVLRPAALPVAFALAYDPRRVDPRDDFAVEARVSVGREIHHASGEVLVITHGRPVAVDVVVEAVAAYPFEAQPAVAPAPEARPPVVPAPEAPPAVAPAPVRPPAPEPSAAERASLPGPTPAAPKPEVVLFAPGNPRTAITGRVHGYEVREYVIEARARQTLGVRMDSRNAFAHFAVRAGDDVLFDSRAAPSRGWSGALPRSGACTLRVYLRPEEADRGGSAEFSLQLEMH